MRNFFSNFSKVVGIFLIILFCSLSIFFSIMIREVEDPAIRKALSYSSFFENKFYDFRMLNSLKQEKDKNSVLIKIDDYTLQKLQQWPLPRVVWANLLDKLSTMNRPVVAFDVLFSEKSQQCSETTSSDTVFAQSIENYQNNGGKVILSYTVTENPQEGFEEFPGSLFDFMLDSKQKGGTSLNKSLVAKSTYPIDELTNTMPGLGHISSVEDSDGVFRHYSIVSNVDEIYFPSLGLLGYQFLTGDDPSLEIHDNGMATIKINEGKNEVDLNFNGENKLRFLGDAQSFDSVSLYDVLSAEDGDPKMAQLFKDKIAFIGSTAIGAHDLRNTPVDTKLPGVFVHMNLIHMLVDHYFYQDLDESLRWSFILMFIGITILLFVQSRGNAILDLIAIIAIVGATYYIDVHYFLPRGHELKLFFVNLSFIAVYSWDTFLNFSQTAREKKQIRGTFARYVAPSIVNEMLQNPEKLQTGGDRKNITCMFSDVRDFTSISEKLSPQELSTVMNEYMNKMTGIVFETQGTLDKYIGDAIVAYWGAPLEVDNHPQKAVEAAIQMINIMPEINEDFKQKGYPEFKIGIGLNSGECSVGNMGSDFIFSYTALGDNMNLGARLEGLCKPYGSQINVSEFTWDRIDHNVIKGRILDKVKVKGKEKPVAIYEIFHDSHPLKSDLTSLDTYNKGYQLFLDKEFEIARQKFVAFLEKYPEDVAAERLVKICEHYLEAPPMPGEDHDVTTFTTK